MSIARSQPCGTCTRASSTSTRRQSAPRSICRLAEPRRPATAIAKPAQRRSTCFRSGSRCTWISAAGCSARRSTPRTFDLTLMNWAIAGVVYAVAYVALTIALADAGWTRTLAGNIGLLLPPLSLMIAIVRRRGAWRGRQAVFWGAIGAWPVLWFLGQIVWAADEVFLGTPLPWFKWPIIMQLCASALPLIALVAWPHRSVDPEKSSTIVLDIAVLVFLTGFLYWSLI